jgi:hypothetical protein
VRFLRNALHTRLRVQRHPVFPAPSISFEGERSLENSGRSCRGNADARHPFPTVRDARISSAQCPARRPRLDEVKKQNGTNGR